MDQTIGKRIAQQQIMSNRCKISLQVSHPMVPGGVSSTTTIAVLTTTWRGSTIMMIRLSLSFRKGFMNDQPEPIKRITLQTHRETSVKNTDCMYERIGKLPNSCQVLAPQSKSKSQSHGAGLKKRENCGKSGQKHGSNERRYLKSSVPFTKAAT